MDALSHSASKTRVNALSQDEPKSPPRWSGTGPAFPLAPIRRIRPARERRLAGRTAECLIRRTARESSHFNPKGNCAVRVQTVNSSGAPGVQCRGTRGPVSLVPAGAAHKFQEPSGPIAVDAMHGTEQRVGLIVYGQVADGRVPRACE